MDKKLERFLILFKFGRFLSLINALQIFLFYNFFFKMSDAYGIRSLKEWLQPTNMNALIFFFNNDQHFIFLRFYALQASRNHLGMASNSGKYFVECGFRPQNSHMEYRQRPSCQCNRMSSRRNLLYVVKQVRKYWGSSLNMGHLRKKNPR